MSDSFSYDCKMLWITTYAYIYTGKPLTLAPLSRDSAGPGEADQQRLPEAAGGPVSPAEHRRQHHQQPAGAAAVHWGDGRAGGG